MQLFSTLISTTISNWKVLISSQSTKVSNYFETKVVSHQQIWVSHFRFALTESTFRSSFTRWMPHMVSSSLLFYSILLFSYVIHDANFLREEIWWLKTKIFPLRLYQSSIKGNELANPEKNNNLKFKYCTAELTFCALYNNIIWWAHNVSMLVFHNNNNSDLET
jgi:hypothetical protein